MNVFAYSLRATTTLLLTASMVVCAGSLGAGPKDDGTSKDVDRLQGDWVMVEYGSIKYKEGEVDQFHCNIYIQKDRAIFHFNGTDPDDEVVTTFAVDASKNPKEIDFVGVGSTIPTFKKGEKTLGIYKLDGDSLTLCRAAEKKGDRPKDFKTLRDEGVYVCKFVRSKKPISQDSGQAHRRPK